MEEIGENKKEWGSLKVEKGREKEEKCGIEVYEKGQQEMYQKGVKEYGKDLAIELKLSIIYSFVILIKNGKT